MTTLKGKQILGNQLLEQAFGSLQKGLVPQPVGKCIMANAKEMDAALTKINTKRVSIVEKYAKTDANGKVVMKEDGQYDIVGDMAELDKEIKALLEEDYEIAAPKIDPRGLQHVRLTPAEWEVLEPFCGTTGLKLVS